MCVSGWRFVVRYLPQLFRYAVCELLKHFYGFFAVSPRHRCATHCVPLHIAFGFDATITVLFSFTINSRWRGQWLMCACAACVYVCVCVLSMCDLLSFWNYFHHTTPPPLRPRELLVIIFVRSSWSVTLFPMHGANGALVKWCAVGFYTGAISK